MHGALLPQNLTLRLGDRTVSVMGGPSFAALQSAVALLRTIFEEHFADPEYDQCLFFHGCTLIGAGREKLNFSVHHHEDRVILSDWNWEADGPAISSIRRRQYAQAILDFAQQVRQAGFPDGSGPTWLRQYAHGLWLEFSSLRLLAGRYLKGDDAGYHSVREAYWERHGSRRRPLELVVDLVLGELEPWTPIRVLTRPVFGPLKQGAHVPLRINGDHLVRGLVEEFRPGGVALLLEGVGWDGIKQGDRLLGLEMFH